MYNIRNIRRDLTISTELKRSDTKEFMLSGSFYVKYRNQQDYAALLEDSSQWFWRVHGRFQGTGQIVS